MKKILIFEPYSNQALAIAKYIKKYSDYYIIGVLEEKRFFNREYYDEIIVDDITNIEFNEYDYIFPMGAKSTYYIIDNYKKLCYKNELFFSYHNLIVYNKPEMLNIAESLDIPIPKTFCKKEDIVNFPIFYKENFENGGGIRGIARNIDDIPSYPNLIYQEYINTPSTYGVGFLAKNGEIVTFFQHKEIISYPEEGGSAVVIESFYDERLLKYTKKLLKKLNYNGWGLAEFKYCNKRKDYVFMEINAKFWASIEFMLMNNVDFLYYLLGINYKTKKAKKIVFVERYLQYNLISIVKNLKYIKNTNKFIIENGYCYIGFVLLKKIVPKFIQKFLKRLLK